MVIKPKMDENQNINLPKIYNILNSLNLFYKLIKKFKTQNAL